MITRALRVLHYGMLIVVNSAIAQNWIQTSAVTNVWTAIACSADGARLVACANAGSPYVGRPGPIYLSTDGGMSWTQTSAPTNYWAAVASSADGSRLVAVLRNSSLNVGGIFTSLDSGSTWTLKQVAVRQCIAAASSADGTRMFVTTDAGQLYSTTNSGNSWISNAVPGGASPIACSADGTRLVAAGNGHISISTNSGGTWVANPSTPFALWSSVASSADGRVLAAAESDGGSVYVSTDSGATWALRGVQGLYWQNVAVSADGRRLVATAWRGTALQPGPLYTSADSGLTWASNNVPQALWSGAACSGDGAKLIAASAGTNNVSVGQGRIWVSQTTPSPTLSITPANGIQLSWPIPSTRFLIQESFDLAGWTTVTDTPVLDFTNLSYQIALPISNSPAFFRLATP